MNVLFDTEIKEATRFYNIINNIFWVLSIVGSYIIAGAFSTTTTINTSSYFASTTTETDNVMLFSIFGGLLVTYTLLYIVIRVFIKSYGENLRANLYNQLLLDKLIDNQIK